jgi:hypothetical protein
MGKALVLRVDYDDAYAELWAGLAEPEPCLVVCATMFGFALVPKKWW